MSMARIGDVFPPAERQAALAKLMLATILGLSIGQFCAGLLGETVHWRAIFLLLSVGFLVAAIRLRGGGPESPCHDASAGYLKGVCLVLGRSSARQVLLFTFIEGMLVLPSLALIPTYL